MRKQVSSKERSLSRVFRCQGSLAIRLHTVSIGRNDTKVGPDILMCCRLSRAVDRDVLFWEQQRGIGF